jgi:ubiquinol-cytochrome c reductase iron-sulfur subunit
VLWRGKPVFIRRRTQEEIAEARSVKMEDLIHQKKMKIEQKILNG